MNERDDTGNVEKLPFHDLPPDGEPITLADLLTRLGEEWRPALLAAAGKDLKWISHFCNGKNDRANLVWEETIIKTEVARAWLACQPSFTGLFKGAPPRLTRASILKRIGDSWKTPLEKSYLSKDRAARSNQDEFKTDDVAAWYASRQPPAPATPEPIPPEKPIAALLALLDEVDKRAAEQGAGFNRSSLPGTKQEFHRLAIAFNRRTFSRALSTFSDYMKGHCQFQHGDKPEQGKGAAVWALFPEYSLKLG